MRKRAGLILSALLVFAVLCCTAACGEKKSTGIDVNDPHLYESGYEAGYREARTAINEDNSVNILISGSFTAHVRDLIPIDCADGADDTPQVAVVALFQSGPFTVYLSEEQCNSLEIGETYTFEVGEKKTKSFDDFLHEKGQLDPETDLRRYSLEIVNIRDPEEDEYGLECDRLMYEILLPDEKQ